MTPGRPPEGAALNVDEALTATESLDALLARTADGDRPAFTRLFDRVAPTVLGLAHRVVRDAALAEEITQEVLLAVWGSAGSFDARLGSARSWILTQAHRRAVDVVRREQSSRDRIARVGVTTLERGYDDVVETVVDRSEAAALKAALSRLTPIQRQALNLAYFEGLTHREVAEALDIPLGTAKARIADGLRGLRRALQC